MEPKPQVLIVEDDARGREVLAALLARSDCGLLFADDGHEALVLAARALPDLVLLDVMLPDLDGFEVCRRMRADLRLAEVPIVLVTALDDRDSRLKGFEAGADDFLTKPFDRLELLARVRSVLRLNRFRRLVREREKFAELFNFSPDGLVVTGLDGAVLLANPTIHGLLGASDTVQPPVRMADMVAPERREEFAAWLATVSGAAGDHRYLETEFTTLQKKTFPVELSARRFQWVDQPAIQIHARNVSDEKLLEAKFLRAQRLESIGTLAGGIAHDLNNVLTPILASLRFLKDDLKGHPSRRWVELMETSAMRGSGIIQQILAFTRGAGGLHEPLQIKYVFEELQRFIRETFPSTIELRMAVARDTGMIRADATQIQQVLMNLSVNARDAMADGGVLKIEASNRRIDAILSAQLPGTASGDYVQITVSDTGCGMSPEVKEQIFEAFFTTKPVGKGTGLGLSTVRSIVESHGGFVSVESDVGCGTSFTLLLPAVLLAEKTPPDSPATPCVPQGSGEHLLVVEDDPAISEILQGTLERSGYRVTLARDGAEAVAVVARQSASLRMVLADSTLPVLCGYPLVRTLQRLLPPSVIFVMCDGLTQSRLKEQLGEEGAGFLVKPFSAEQLLNTVASALQDTRIRPSGTKDPDLLREFPATMLEPAGARCSGT
jgi:PAS domain S-box-containing protein